MEIKLLDEFIQETDIAKNIADKFGGCLHKYSNPSLIPPEVVFVMKSVYKIDRNEISTVLQNILPAFKCEDSRLLTTVLAIFSERSLDFVDCILASYKKLYNLTVESFDKKLNNLMKSLTENES